MPKRLYVILSLLMIGMIVLSACGKKGDDPIGTVDIDPGDPVHIASMLTISGPTSFLGIDSVGAIKIAIEERGGELLGHQIEYTSLDSGCSAEGGLTVSEEVAADPSILGVIGTNCSSAAIGAIENISNAGLVMLAPSNVAPSLTLEEDRWMPGYYRIVHSDLMQGQLAAEFAYNELGVRKAATINDGSPYTGGLQYVFSERFRELGGKITFQGEINIGDTDFRTILASVASGEPDLLYFPLFEPEGPFIVAQSSEFPELEDIFLMGSDGLLANTFPENSGPNVVGMYLTGPHTSGAAYEDFLAEWMGAYGGMPPSGFHAFAYDATNILLDAIEAVAVVDKDGTLHVGRQALRDYLSNLSGYHGLSGEIDCSDKDFGDLGISHGDCSTGGSIAIFEITEDELYGNWPPEPVYIP